MIGKETWKIGTDRDKMEKLIKYHMHVHCKKRFFEKDKTSSSNREIIEFFL